MRTEPTRRSVFAHAKVIHVLGGLTRIETEEGARLLHPGMTFTLGAGRWCSVQPLPSVRMWTIYLNENFLRTHVRWIFAPDDGPHVPPAWDGTPVVSHVGVELIRRIEPVWRQISVLDRSMAREKSAVRQIALFAEAFEIALPAFIGREPGAILALASPFPVEGALTVPPASQPVAQAVAALRARMAEPWTVGRLSKEVATSSTHLARMFEAHVGLPPMRFLVEARLTEFTRLIEETSLPLSAISRTVGWRDSRIAAKWFRRRFGKSPSEYRGHPHPSSTSVVPGPACGDCEPPRST